MAESIENGNGHRSSPNSRNYGRSSSLSQQQQQQASNAVGTAGTLQRRVVLSFALFSLLYMCLWGEKYVSPMFYGNNAVKQSQQQQQQQQQNEVGYAAHPNQQRQEDRGMPPPQQPHPKLQPQPQPQPQAPQVATKEPPRVHDFSQQESLYSTPEVPDTASSIYPEATLHAHGIPEAQGQDPAGGKPDEGGEDETPPATPAEDEDQSHRLECRDSVMEYVINASDQKDECDGLRRAFDAACTNLDMAENIFTSGQPVKRSPSYNPKVDYVNPNLIPQSSDVWGNHGNDRQLQAIPAPPTLSATPGNMIQQPFQESPQGFLNTPKVHPSQLYSHAQSILESPESIEARTCCASILNVFHEHCDRNEEVEYTDRSLFVIVSVIAMCGIVKSLIRHFELRWLPEAGGCILVGVVLGGIMESMPNVHFSFDGSLFLRVMLPFIVFHAALSIDKRTLYENRIPILMYACFGTFMSSALIAIIVHVGTGFTMPAVESFIFGALISSIDPIAILSVLTSIGMSNTDAIYVMIFGESLFNDGVAIVLYETLIRFLDEQLEVSSMEIWEATMHFFVVMVGSTVVGVLSGGCCTFYYYSMKGCQTPLMEVLIFICWALIPYYICDGLAWSGIVGIIAASIMMDLFVVGEMNGETHQSLDVPGTTMATPPRRGVEDPTNQSPGGSSSERSKIFTKKGHLSPVARTHIGFVSEINSTLMETSIFAYLGLFLLSARYKWNLYLNALAIFSCLLSRAVMIPTLSLLINKFCNTIPKRGSNMDHKHQAKVDARMQIVLWFGGLRGAMSFALVENIPLYDASTRFGSRLKPELKAMTSASIIFSVFICGGSTFYLLQNLGMTTFRKDVTAVDTDTEMQSLTSTSNLVKASPEPVERKETFRSGGGTVLLNGGSSHGSVNGRDAGGVRHR